MANTKASEAGSVLGKRSVRIRKQLWGEDEFKRRLREWGKLGGRPRKQQEQEK